MVLIVSTPIKLTKLWKTLQLCNRIDENILVIYASQAVNSVPTLENATEQGRFASRLLEIAVVQSLSDGEVFASQLVKICNLVDSKSSTSGVLHSVVETVLGHCQTGEHLTNQRDTLRLTVPSRY